MDAIPYLKPSEIGPYLSILDEVRDSGLLERFDVDIGARLFDVQEHVRQVSAHFYELKMQELQSAPGVNRALPLLLMSDELEKAAKLLDKRFPEAILGCSPDHSHLRSVVLMRIHVLLSGNSIWFHLSSKSLFLTSSRTCRTRRSGCSSPL